MIRKGLVGLLLIMFASVVQADVIPPVLNQVNLQLSAEQWVTTKTALVVVEINATLNDKQLSNAHADIMSKLNKLASNADWHITEFNRSQNQSGLEQVRVLAQTRLPETALADLRGETKSISKAGETFALQSIAFIPTLAETEAVRSQLRGEIYHDVQNELATLNKTYPNQKYVVHNINFNEQNNPQPVPVRMMAMTAGAANDESRAPLTVANKIVLNADVSLVSVNQ